MPNPRAPALIARGHELLTDLVEDLHYIEESRRHISAALTCPDHRDELAETCLGLFNSSAFEELYALSLLIVAQNPGPGLLLVLNEIRADIDLARTPIPDFMQDLHRFTDGQLSSEEVEDIAEGAGRHLEQLSNVLQRLERAFLGIIPRIQQIDPPNEESSSEESSSTNEESSSEESSSTNEESSSEESSSNFSLDMDMDLPDLTDHDLDDHDLDGGGESSSIFPQEIDLLDFDELNCCFSSFVEDPHTGTTEIVPEQGSYPFQEVWGPELLELGDPEILEYSVDFLQALGSLLLQ